MKKDQFPSLFRPEQIFSAVDQFFQHSFPLTDFFSAIRYRVTESEKEFFIFVELPGTKKEQIGLQTTADGLRVFKRHQEHMINENEQNQHYVQQQYAAFVEQIIPLPGRIEAKDVKATFQDGLLQIRIPKKQLRKKQGENSVPIE